MIPARLSPDRLAKALAARLDAVVPDSISVRANGDGVGVYDPEWWGDSVIADIAGTEDGRSITERVEAAAVAIMDATQDKVMESTKEQWPLGPAGAANPDARVVGHELHLWFGDEAAPVLRLQPVDLNELVDGAA